MSYGTGLAVLRCSIWLIQNLEWYSSPLLLYIQHAGPAPTQPVMPQAVGYEGLTPPEMCNALDGGATYMSLGFDGVWVPRRMKPSPSVDMVFENACEILSMIADSGREAVQIYWGSHSAYKLGGDFNERRNEKRRAPGGTGRRTRRHYTVDGALRTYYDQTWEGHPHPCAWSWRGLHLEQSLKPPHTPHCHVFVVTRQAGDWLSGIAEFKGIPPNVSANKYEFLTSKKQGRGAAAAAVQWAGLFYCWVENDGTFTDAAGNPHRYCNAVPAWEQWADPARRVPAKAFYPVEPRWIDNMMRSYGCVWKQNTL
eukprot:gene2622-3026_t